MNEAYTTAYTTSFKSKWFLADAFKSASIHLRLTGTASGSASVQYSNDLYSSPARDTSAVTDSDSTLTLSGNDNHFWELTTIGAKWVRLSLTVTGTGTAEIDFVGKR